MKAYKSSLIPRSHQSAWMQARICPLQVVRIWSWLRWQQGFVIRKIRAYMRHLRGRAKRLSSFLKLDNQSAKSCLAIDATKTRKWSWIRIWRARSLSTLRWAKILISKIRPPACLSSGTFITVPGERVSRTNSAYTQQSRRNDLQHLSTESQPVTIRSSRSWASTILSTKAIQSL